MPPLAYQLYGAPDRPTLVVLHGFLGSGQDWAAVAGRLQADWRIVAIDLPGHGGSAHLVDVKQYTMSAAAAAVQQTLDRLGVGQAALLGYSMGGRLALYLGLHAPWRFTCLALESASPGLRTAGERAARRAADEQLAQRLEHESLVDFLTAWYNLPLFAGLRQHPDFPALLTRRQANHPQALARSLRGMGVGVQPSLWDAWARCSLPTLLLVGGEDDKYVALAAEMQRLHPPAQVAILAGCTHTPHLENVEAFITALRPFLASAQMGAF